MDQWINGPVDQWSNGNDYTDDYIDGSFHLREAGTKVGGTILLLNDFDDDHDGLYDDDFYDNFVGGVDVELK